MGKVIKITESQLRRIIDKVINENLWTSTSSWGNTNNQDNSDLDNSELIKKNDNSELIRIGDMLKQNRRKKIKDRASEFIKDNDIKTRGQFGKLNPSLYHICNQYELMDELIPLGDVKKFRKEKYKKEIEDYITKNNIKNQIELQRSSPMMYMRARRYDLFSDLFGDSNMFQKFSKNDI